MPSPVVYTPVSNHDTEDHRIRSGTDATDSTIEPNEGERKVIYPFLVVFGKMFGFFRDLLLLRVLRNAVTAFGVSNVALDFDFNLADSHFSFSV